MYMFRKFVSVVALATVAAVSAHAQAAAPAVKPITFGIKAGASLPTGDFADAVKTGFLAGAQIGFATPSLPVTFRVDADYNQYSSKIASGNNLKVWGFTGNALFHIPTTGVVRPYVIAGAGLYNASAGGNSSNDFGFNAGAGINMPLSGFNTFIEARYTRISTDVTATQYVPVYFGVSF
jgi:opacity protein-like surface antigen